MWGTMIKLKVSAQAANVRQSYRAYYPRFGGATGYIVLLRGSCMEVSPISYKNRYLVACAKPEKLSLTKYVGSRYQGIS